MEGFQTRTENMDIAACTPLASPHGAAEDALLRGATPSYRIG
jgi:hypothetical protein